MAPTKLKCDLKWLETHPGKASLRIWFYLLLTLTVVWDLGRPGYRFFISSGVGERTGCQLDSFSEPSIAAAILKQEAERLFAAYVQERNIELDAAFTDRYGSGQPGAGQTSSDEIACEEAAARRAEARTSTVQSLEHFRAAVEDLKCDLDLRLLTIRSETGLWPEFLDHYLEFLRESPDNPFVTTWARCALIQAQECGRTSEVVEALEHAAQIHSESNIARTLRQVLALWAGEERHTVTAPNP